MNDLQSLSHTKWSCKFHVVWIPKGRKKPCMDNGDNTWAKSWANWLGRGTARQWNGMILPQKNGHSQAAISNPPCSNWAGVRYPRVEWLRSRL